jgi:DNA-binding CsgD family transcriptional regulator
MTSSERIRRLVRLREDLAVLEPADERAALRWLEALQKLDELRLCLVHESGADAAAVSRLTRRETDVLRYVSRGDKSYAEIALIMGIKVETVRKHTASIRVKLKVKSRRDLVGLRVPDLSR